MLCFMQPRPQHLFGGNEIGSAHVAKCQQLVSVDTGSFGVHLQPFCVFEIVSKNKKNYF